MGDIPGDEFDDALWFFVCERVTDKATFKALPIELQYFYASRYLEWEVGNGGFAQAAFNVPELFESARLGYLALDLAEAADLISQAQALLASGRGGITAGVGGDLGELFKAFSESALAELDSKLDDVGWWATERRSAYALANRGAFERVV
nr:DUF4375 domain-containing protein [Ramlibacter cellulosilyticus]